MGHRSYLVDLDKGVKIYLHWAAIEVDKAENMLDLTQRVLSNIDDNFSQPNYFKGLVSNIAKAAKDENSNVSVNPHAMGEISIKEHNIKRYTDEDALDDLNLHIESVFVSKDNIISRAYTYSSSYYPGTMKSENVYFKVDDNGSLKAYQRFNNEFSRYMRAYCYEDVPNAAGKALTHALYKGLDDELDTRLQILLSTTEPSKEKLSDKLIDKIDPNESTANNNTSNTGIPKIKRQNRTTQKTFDPFTDIETESEEKRKRKQRAKNEDMKIKKIEKNKYKVKDKYVVNLEKEECSCPDYIYNGYTCKHIYKVKFYLKEEDATNKN